MVFGYLLNKKTSCDIVVKAMGMQNFNYAIIIQTNSYFIYKKNLSKGSLYSYEPHYKIILNKNTLLLIKVIKQSILWICCSIMKQLYFRRFFD